MSDIWWFSWCLTVVRAELVMSDVWIIQEITIMDKKCVSISYVSLVWNTSPGCSICHTTLLTQLVIDNLHWYSRQRQLLILALRWFVWREGSGQIKVLKSCSGQKARKLTDTGHNSPVLTSPAFIAWFLRPGEMLARMQLAGEAGGKCRITQC